MLATLTVEVAGDADTPYERIREAALAVEERLRAEPGVHDVDSTVEAEATRLVFAPDPEKAARSGVSVAEIAATVRLALAGDTATTLNLAASVWVNAAKPKGWRRLGVVNDHLPEQHKVSRIWGQGKRGNATKVDRILILAPPGSAHKLPPARRDLIWAPATTWADSPTEEQ